MNHIDTIDTAVVLGAGTMGAGIAQVLAMSGVEARLVDVNQDALDRASARIRAALDKGVDKGKVEASVRDAALERLHTRTDLAEACHGANGLVEAVPEKLELKTDLLGLAAEHLPATALIASNTSSLSLTAIADAVPHPERVTGMHFFNPVHIMKLVEVVRADQSSDAAVEATVGLAVRMGKDPIVVKDRPGFASSRLGIAIGLEAIRMVEEQVASAEDIDKAMTLGYGFPMGPLRLTDLVGLDVRLSIAEYLTEKLGPRFEPPQLLRNKVAAGELGKKSGAGFYRYDD